VTDRLGTYEGNWWLPERPDRKIRGTLHVGAEPFALATTDALVLSEPTEGSHPLAVWMHLPRVLGIADGNTRITLYDVAGLSMFAWGASEVRESWSARTVLLGEHTEVDQVFAEVWARPEHMDDFVRSSVTRTVLRDADENFIGYEARAERIVLAEGLVPEVGTVKISIEPELQDTANGIALQRPGWLSVSFDAPVDYDDAYQTARRLRDLVRLATGCRCELVAVDVRTSEVGPHLGLLRWQGETALDPCEQAGQFRLLFDAHSLPAAPETFSQWWSVRERHEPAWRLLTNFDDQRVANLNEKFAVLARAIEGLHEADLPRPALAKDERDERVELALDSLPDDLKEWAALLLEASTPPYFKHRVREIIKAIGPAGERLSGGDPEKFGMGVAATRNWIIHPRQKRSSNVLDEPERYWVANALRLIAQLYLGRAIGMSEEDLNTRLGLLRGGVEIPDRVRAIFAASQESTNEASPEGD
jgi:ApeA N-terminal domain 1